MIAAQRPLQLQFMRRQLVCDNSELELHTNRRRVQSPV